MLEAAPRCDSARGSAISKRKGTLRWADAPRRPLFYIDHSFGLCLRRHIGNARKLGRGPARWNMLVIMISVLYHGRRAHHADSVGTFFRDGRSWFHKPLLPPTDLVFRRDTLPGSVALVDNGTHLPRESASVANFVLVPSCARPSSAQSCRREICTVGFARYGGTRYLYGYQPGPPRQGLDRLQLVIRDER